MTRGYQTGKVADVWLSRRRQRIVVTGAALAGAFVIYGSFAHMY